MSRKKKSTIVVIESKGHSWDPDDFDLDSHGVQAPQRGERSDPTTRLDVSSSARTPAH
jgi:hypothetical protein